VAVYGSFRGCFKRLVRLYLTPC